MHAAPEFTLGIEEEYLLVHPESGELLCEAPAALMPAMQAKLGDVVTTELLQSQVEIATPVCRSIHEARTHLTELRASVSQVAQQHDLAIIAASTHPFADPLEQRITKKERYQTLVSDLQGVGRRLLISGMHVHVGIDDDDLRIDLMNQASYILPHILALSTSSPFWQGLDTGLKSYRMSIWDEMPRTGLPHAFDSYSEYQRHVQLLCNAGVIEDATKIWWDLRPSAKFPTLEMRISDICTSLEDALCIAALVQCWMRMLYRLRLSNKRWRAYSGWLISENRWRAHRYGIDEGLIDFGRGEIVPYPQLLEEILGLIEADAQELDCVKEVEHARTILKRGTSAHRQLGVYYAAIDQGDQPLQALQKVVAWLQQETVRL